MSFCVKDAHFREQKARIAKIWFLQLILKSINIIGLTLLSLNYVTIVGINFFQRLLVLSSPMTHALEVAINNPTFSSVMISISVWQTTS